MRESSTLPSPDAGRPADPPRVEAPVSPGPRGRLAHIESHPPTWLRVPLKAAAIGTAAGAAYALVVTLPGRVGIIPGDALASPVAALWVALGAAWTALTYRLLRSLGRRNPGGAGQLHAALLVVPAMLLWVGPVSILLHVGLWIAAVLFSGLLGRVIGAVVYEPSSPLVVVEAERHEE